MTPTRDSLIYSIIGISLVRLTFLPFINYNILIIVELKNLKVYLSLHGCALTHSMVNYSQALERHQVKDTVNTENAPISRRLYLTEATTKTFLLIPIYFVILISYLFTAKKHLHRLINLRLWFQIKILIYYIAESVVWFLRLEIVFQWGFPKYFRFLRAKKLYVCCLHVENESGWRFQIVYHLYYVIKKQKSKSKDIFVSKNVLTIKQISSKVRSKTNNGKLPNDDFNFFSGLTEGKKKCSRICHKPEFLFGIFYIFRCLRSLYEKYVSR